MSLYEQFYSDINKNFMFNMIKDIIQKDTKFDISIDSTNYDHFLSTFDKVFNDNHFEEIEQANKLLLDTNINYFLKNIQQRGNNIETDLFNPFENLTLDDSISISNVSQYAVALGLAIRGGLSDG